MKVNIRVRHHGSINIGHHRECRRTLFARMIFVRLDSDISFWNSFLIDSDVSEQPKRWIMDGSMGTTDDGCINIESFLSPDTLLGLFIPTVQWKTDWKRFFKLSPVWNLDHVRLDPTHVRFRCFISSFSDDDFRLLSDQSCGRELIRF